MAENRSGRRSAASEGRPSASSAVVRLRMRNTPRRDTPEELAIRSALHRLGFRFRVDATVMEGLRTRADLVFRTARVAVFVDGCFWHGCPQHGTWPKANADWWRAKIRDNRARDTRTNLALRRAGWLVIRIWAHRQPDDAAKQIAGVLRRRLNSLP